MLKQTINLLLLILICFALNAQKGNNGLSLNAEATVPIYQDDRGFGFFLKGLYGIGQSAQLTLSGGVSRFTSKNNIEQGRVTTRVIPFLFGYRQNIHRFFIEPKIGLGELGGKISINGDYSRPSVAAIFGGLGAGYTVKRINVGISFQTAHGIDNSAAGIWYNKNFHYTSIFLGYNLLPEKNH
jgi:hypothetical protein